MASLRTKLTQRRRFNEWVDSGEEPTDNTARFCACLVIDTDSSIDVTAAVKVWKEKEESLDEFDNEGAAWVWLNSKDESKGQLRVSM